MSDEHESTTRRDFLRQGAALATGAALMSLPTINPSAWAAGSDAPEKKEVRIGFIPLTDCASVVMASVMKFDEKYGIRIIPTKEASWASVRDKLVNGELDAAHVLYGLVYGVHLGLGGPQKNMNVLMTLNHNGQGITLANQLKDKGAIDGGSLAALIARKEREYTFAHTFPSGTHAMWLYYWLATYGINPFRDIKNIVVPPPQMVANMRVGNMDGYCVGEPWNQRAIIDRIGFSVATSQDVWPDHPERCWEPPPSGRRRIRTPRAP
jgi:nitrate/nitrite transport system substrate-binding protein